MSEKDYKPPTKPSRSPKSERAPEELTLKEAKKKLSEYEKLKEKYLAGWQRCRADFLNYKKEELERIGELIKHAGNGFILKLLPILDNFEIAEKNIPQEVKKDENIKGLLQIKDQLKKFLKKQGVEAIECLGEKFDPHFHEVVEEVEIKNKKSGVIIEEVQKGYKCEGQVIRPSKVKIAK